MHYKLIQLLTTLYCLPTKPTRLTTIPIKHNKWELKKIVKIYTHEIARGKQLCRRINEITTDVLYLYSLQFWILKQKKNFRNNSYSFSVFLFLFSFSNLFSLNKMEKLKTFPPLPSHKYLRGILHRDTASDNTILHWTPCLISIIFDVYFINSEEV